MIRVRVVVFGVIALFAANASLARADCRCVAVAGDVAAAVQADVARADGLYARGEFTAALAIYAKAYASSKDPALLYAQGMVQWQLGVNDQAKAMLSAYVEAKGALTYKDRAEAGLADLGAGVTAAVGSAVGATSAVAGGAAGAGLGVTGEVRGRVDAKPKVGHAAAIALGVIAIAAIGTVGVHSIAAGISDKVDLDPKFDLGLGVAGLSVGITAFYVAGLSAAASTASGVRCASFPGKQPIVAPIALRGGGGLAAAMSF